MRLSWINQRRKQKNAESELFIPLLCSVCSLDGRVGHLNTLANHVLRPGTSCVFEAKLRYTDRLDFDYLHTILL